MAKLSFVIPAYNEENHIQKCLDSVCAQAKDYGDRVEIIVVNNASTDQTAEIARAYPNVKVVDEPHKGLVWARRAGYLASSGDLIANVDSDTILTPHWLETVFAEFAKNPKLVGLSGPFKYYDLPKQTLKLVNLFYRAGYVVYLFNRFVLRNGSMLQGGNFIITRTGLEKIGGYDTSIEFWGEDSDIARRLHAVGDVKFTPKLPMLTSGRRLATEGAFTMGFKYARNYFWMIFFKKPKDRAYVDHRPTDASKPTFQAGRTKREIIIGTSAIFATLVILSGAGFLAYLAGEHVIASDFSVSQATAATIKWRQHMRTNISNLSQKAKAEFQATLKELKEKRED